MNAVRSWPFRISKVIVGTLGTTSIDVASTNWYIERKCTNITAPTHFKPTPPQVYDVGPTKVYSIEYASARTFLPQPPQPTPPQDERTAPFRCTKARLHPKWHRASCWHGTRHGGCKVGVPQKLPVLLLRDLSVKSWFCVYGISFELICLEKWLWRFCRIETLKLTWCLFKEWKLEREPTILEDVWPATNGGFKML